MRYSACIEYDGTQFSGWQRQKHNVRTVQGRLEKALSKLADEDIAIITAGRTDTGVHATHQVIHFDGNAERSDFAWCRGTNRFLDHDVRMRWVKPVNDDFHARFSATSRSYRFIIHNNPICSAIFRNYASHEYRQLDFQKMRDAGGHLVGEHDFSSFRAAGCQAHSPVRTISNFKLYQKDHWIWFDINANAFLQHMVRNIAGALIEVGAGKRDLEWIKYLLDVRDRTKGSITAPPNGLYLTGVEYPEEFDLLSESHLISYWNS
ncbi:MAG: tRNA pseudouridine(38-40) synthase TruA [Acidiferrobacterales bacterium]|nr:tRNA pseudouridine(38-40) synthase TruA [Acidiferrobacterales bacterium]